MTRAKHPKPYNKGPRKQMTVAWKKEVIQKLEDNRLAGLKPANVEQLRVAVKAKKGGLDRTFDLDTKKPQTSSSYVDQICEVLDIQPPLQEVSAEDREDVARLASFPPEIRRRLIDIGEQLLKK